MGKSDAILVKRITQGGNGVPEKGEIPLSVILPSANYALSTTTLVLTGVFS
jgi:hypothetical protein